MKKLIYKIMGYTSIYNPKTDEVEQVETPAKVEVENPAEQDIAYAEEVAFNGEYTVEGEFDDIPAPTLENRVGTLETDSTEMKEALEMILSGVTE